MGNARFNKTFVTGVVKRLYDARSYELLASTDPSPQGEEALKRAWGAMQALHWVSAGYDLGVVPAGPRARFMKDHGVPEKITKTAVVTRLIAEAAKLEKAHGFTSRTGWNQVDGKGSYMNRTYGFWSELNTLVEELGLMEVPTN